MAERVERVGEVEDRLDPQQIGDHRLMEIIRGERCRDPLREPQPAVHQDQHGEGLADLLFVGLVVAHQRACESPAVEQVEEGEDDPGHRHQPVIARAEQTDDEEGRDPGDDLADDLAARFPDHAGLHLRGEACLELSREGGIALRGRGGEIGRGGRLGRKRFHLAGGLAHRG